MEASALTHAQKRGLFTRPTPLLRLQGDDGLVALTRRGNPAAFEVLVQRYQPRLLGFCRQMLRSTEDAEDVLQEVFVAAHRAMLADEREIAVRPWLYRIARNRCLNHLRRPVPDGQDTMDMLPMENGASVHDRVQNREEFRSLLKDVDKLPETQRSALLLREMDAMSYEEIATSMETTVPGVKSLLVRARIALAESSQARQLTCDEVKLELAEAAEGLTKASGPVRRHVRDCESCKDFRGQLRADSKALAAILPVPALALLKGAILAKLGIGGGSAASGAAGGGAAGGGGAAAATGGAAAAGGGAAAGGAAAGAAGAVGGAAAAGGAAAGGAGGIGAVGAIGGTIGAKVGVGMASAVLLTAGAVEVKHTVDKRPQAAKQAAAHKNAKPDALLAAQDPTAPTTPADPAAAKPVDPTVQPTEQVVEPVPVDPAAGTTDPAAITTGGVVIQQARHGKRKHRRKIAVADANPQTGNSSAGSSGTISTGPGDEGNPADPGTGTGTGTGDTGGTPVLTPP